MTPGATFSIVDKGTFAGATLTAPDDFDLPVGAVMEIERSRVLSAYLLDLLDLNQQTIPPDYDFPPFYLADTWGFVRRVVERLTAAGVLARFDDFRRDAAGPHILE